MSEKPHDSFKVYTSTRSEKQKAIDHHSYMAKFHSKKIDYIKKQGTIMGPAHTKELLKHHEDQHAHHTAELEKAKTMKEEIEPIEEISKNSLDSYVKKSFKDINKRSLASHDDYKDGKFVDQKKKIDKNLKRMSGVQAAAKRMVTKEEIEPIEELSHGKLASYVAAAKAKVLPKPGSQDGEKKTVSQARKHFAGVKTANRKLGEEIEQVDELNHDTVTSYKNKASKDLKGRLTQMDSDVKAKKLFKKDADPAAVKNASKIPGRMHGLARADDRLKENVEPIEELNIVQGLKSLVGKSDDQVAAKKSREFAARKKTKPAAPRDSSSPSVHWDHGGYDVTKKKGAVAEDVKPMTAKDRIKALAMGAKLRAEPAKTPAITCEEVIEEGLRLVSKHGSGDHTAKVYKDNDFNEHRVKFYHKGVHQKDADYHTDDKQDAHDTAEKHVNSKNVKEEVEVIDELSKNTLANYTSKAAVDLAKRGRRDGMNIAKNITDKKNDTKMSRRIRGVVKATSRLKEETTMISFKDYLKEDHTEYEYLEIISEELAEEFISHSDFRDKVENHSKHGFVVHHEYDHEKKKALIRHVDHEGEVREFKYHDKGTTVQRLAPLNNKVATTHDGKTVTKHDAPGHVKRGRGRPAGKYAGTYKPRQKN